MTIDWNYVNQEAERRAKDDLAKRHPDTYRTLLARYKGLVQEEEDSKPTKTKAPLPKLVYEGCLPITGTD